MGGQTLYGRLNYRGNVDCFGPNADKFLQLFVYFLPLHVFIKSKDGIIKVLIHILVWTFMTFVLFRFPLLGRRSVPYPDDFIVKQIAHILLMISAFYVNAYYLVPRFLLKNKPVLFIAGITAFVLLSSFALSMIDSWLEISARMEQTHGKRIWAIPYIDTFGLFTSLFVLGISTSIAVTQKWNADNKGREEYERQKMKSELSFLKAQIHPHFFFNTLNSIYALTYTDVDASRKVLHRLSRMMRYLLYETQQNKVSLGKELAFIQDYVDIMKLRVNTNTVILFSLPQLDQDLCIAPMLLLPYVENAFKHGIDDIEMVTITIIISMTARGIVLKTKNKIIGKIGGLYEDSNRTGIGMANTMRRLDLLYKNNYALKIEVDEPNNEYNLQLQINLI